MALSTAPTPTTNDREVTKVFTFTPNNPERFTRQFRNIALFRGDDPARPILTAIAFEHHDDGVRMVATDSYGLAWGDAEGATDGKPLGVEGTATLMADELVAVILKAGVKAQINKIQFDGDSATVTIGRDTFTRDLEPGQFPRWRTLVPAQVDGECSVAPLAGTQLARLAKVKTTTGKATSAVFRFWLNSNELKPCVFSTTADVSGLVMPCKQSNTEYPTP